MTYDWPRSLPPLPIHNSYSRTRVIDVVQDASTGNYIERRRRSRVKMFTHSVVFSLSSSQLTTFHLFYELLGNGVLPFMITDPVYQGKKMKARIQNAGSGGYTETYDADTLDYTVSFILEELPG